MTDVGLGRCPAVSDPRVERVQRELRDLWLRCFTPDARHDPDARARGEEQWRAQRPEHLPRTLEVMGRHQPLEIRYGRRDQADQEGEPTLLLMAGYSPEQISLVIAAHARAGCAEVVPFTGAGVWAGIHEEVAACLQQLRVELGLVAAPVEVDPSDPADVFRKLVRWIRDRPPARCAIDCTGGKTPMDSGAAHAASFYGLPAYYLDFGDYDPQLRRPLPWTCAYQPLALPEVAFSLNARRRAFEMFRAGRFGEAHAAVQELLHADRESGFFESTERSELHLAERLTARATAWRSLSYPDLPEHPLHNALSRATEVEPRALVEEFLAAERFDDLFCYLADEYWRLCLLHNAGEVREALVGLVGVAELTVDRLLREPWFDDVRILSSRPIEWLDLADDPALPDLGAWIGTQLPVGCVPPGAFGAKVKLLRHGRTTFQLWGRPSEAGASLGDPPPSFGEPRLSARVEVALPNGTDSEAALSWSRDSEGASTRAPLRGLSNREWGQQFGAFPHGGWVQNRHALAHLRAPLLLASAVEQVRAAQRTFVPRLMEVLRRVHEGEDLDWDHVQEPGWIRWQAREPWRREDRAPWEESEADFARWLWLRP